MFTTCMIQIPLRFQAANGESPWHAGIRLIAFGLAGPIGVAIAFGICGKRRLPPIYLLVAGCLLQMLGLVFMGRLSLNDVEWKGQYGLQVLVGLGCGFSIAVTTVLAPYVVEKRDLGKNNGPGDRYSLIRLQRLRPQLSFNSDSSAACLPFVL